MDVEKKRLVFRLNEFKRNDKFSNECEILQLNFFRINVLIICLMFFMFFKFVYGLFLYIFLDGQVVEYMIFFEFNGFLLYFLFWLLLQEW